MNRYFRDRLRELMKLDDPPHRLSLAFALGVFIAFSPWLGLHIVSCIALAWMLRLNKMVAVTATLVNNPWTIVPIYAFCLWLGVRITGSSANLPNIAWESLGFGDLFSILRPFLWPFMAGTLIVGALAAVASYGLFYVAITRYRKTSTANYPTKSSSATKST